MKEQRKCGTLGLGGLVVVMGIALHAAADTAQATKPGEETNPNGFPSGEHYNLNIIGKKAEFVCPEQEYDEFGEPMYGNVVFIPQNGSDIQILMQSGKGKWAADVPELRVLDPCTSTFDGDAAVLQLPKSDGGYHVYARALATPTDEPSLEIVPDLVVVQDEMGNDLIYLGLVTDNGFSTPSATFIRKKGKSKAMDITGLFEWTGDVCYFTDAYCEPIEACTEMFLCCVDEDVDGIYESCEVKVDDTCPDGAEEVTALCKSYVNEWVFNIGDFVEYLWQLDNNGLKLLQVRFYPVR
ncbi:MAG: hypothetical protein JSU86_04885 [Phycisphaerales bacterium]|nr:MAG: hypothetical protein JSU86_04885 [Phycisphaerales bacterium]